MGLQHGVGGEMEFVETHMVVLKRSEFEDLIDWDIRLWEHVLQISKGVWSSSDTRLCLVDCLIFGCTSVWCLNGSAILTLNCGFMASSSLAYLVMAFQGSGLGLRFEEAWYVYIILRR